MRGRGQPRSAGWKTTITTSWPSPTRPFLPSIDLDPVKFESIVTLRMDSKVKDLPADTSAGIFTSGLLGESYIGLQPGGDPDVLKAGDEIVFTQPAVDLIQLVGKYMFSGGAGGGAGQKPNDGAQAPATEPQP